MNINKISNLNFQAHFKDDFEYWQLRESMMNLGITNQQVRDCDEFLQTQPDSEIVVNALDEDDHKLYIYGIINTPKGKSEEFLLEDYKTPNCLYTFKDAICELVKKVTSSDK